MNVRNTLALVVVFAVLAGVVFFVNRQGSGVAESEATPTPGPLTELSPEDVQSVKVVQAEEEILIQRTEDGWEIAGDAPRPADKAAVDRVIEQLVKLQPSRTFSDIEDLAVFGLAEPQFTITLTSKEGDLFVLRVGDKNPQGTSRYVQTESGTEIHLVSAFSVEDVQKWVDHPPLPPTPTPQATATPEATETPAGEATPEATATPETTETPATF